MLEFDTFKQIYLNLNQDEKRTFIKSLQDKSGKETSGNEIVKMIELNRALTLSDLFNNYKKDISKDALRKLLDRLIDKLYDVLINKDLILGNPKYDNRAKKIFNLLRQIMVSDILTYRGMSNISEKIINSVSKEAQHYEHFDILVYALGKKLNKNIFNKELISKIEEDIRFSQTSSLVLNQVVNTHIRYLNLDSIVSRAKAIKNFPTDLKRLSEISLNYPSFLIRMYMYYVQLQFLDLNNHVSVGLIKADELIDLVQENSGIYSNLRMANAKLNKALFLRLDYSFDSSISFFEQAKKLLPENLVNNSIIYEQLFLSHYFKGNFSNSKYYLNAMRENVFNSDTKINYYEQASSFVTSNNFKKLESISYNNDNEGSFLNINIRILNIIIGIEKEKFDIVDPSIENLRKYLSKSQFSSILPTRLKLILKILKICSKESYNFKSIYSNAERHLYQLSQPENAWRPNPHELIVFEEWILAKAAGKEYNHTEVMAKMKKRYLERKSPLNLMTA